MSTNSLFMRRYQDFSKIGGMTLAENVIRYRKKAKLTQAQLARKIGARQNTIFAIESGKTVKTKFLPNIAEVLHCTIYDLDPDLAPNGPNGGPPRAVTHFPPAAHDLGWN